MTARAEVPWLMARDVLVRVPGLSQRQLDYWCRNGWVSPSLTAARGRRPGSGFYRGFTEDDVRGVCAVFDTMQLAESLIESCRSGEVFAETAPAEVVAA